MPWWFWVLLWAALLAGSAVALAWAGYWLVRKAIRTARGAGEELARIASGGSGASGLGIHTSDDGGGPAWGEAGRPAPGSAVFADPDEMLRAYRRGRMDRQDARRLRRVARRAARGQAQNPRDLGLI